MSKKKDTERRGDVRVLDRVQKPRRYRVILHNDSYTPRAFVVEILEQVFRIPRGRAAQIMLAVHNSDRGLIGIWPHSIAESKSSRANKLAREFGYPLLTTIEPE